MSHPDEVKIASALQRLKRKEKILHAEASAEGYKDEVCHECSLVLLAFHHFIACESKGCPKVHREPDGSSPTFIDMWIKETEKDKV